MTKNTNTKNNKNTLPSPSSDGEFLYTDTNNTDTKDTNSDVSFSLENSQENENSSDIISLDNVIPDEINPDDVKESNEIVITLPLVESIVEEIPPTPFITESSNTLSITTYKVILVKDESYIVNISGNGASYSKTTSTQNIKIGDSIYVPAEDEYQKPEEQSNEKEEKINKEGN